MASAVSFLKNTKYFLNICYKCVIIIIILFEGVLQWHTVKIIK